MKATQIGFINTLPETKVKDKVLEIDFGTLTLELNPAEVERLYMLIGYEMPKLGLNPKVF
jgi:hypothetical protein